MAMAKLGDGGFSGETKGTGVFYVMRRVDLCPYHKCYQTLATTASAMADGGEVAVALRRRRASIAPPKLGTSFTRLLRS